MSLHSDEPKLQLSIIGDMLVQASDRAGEALAHAPDMGDTDEQALENLLGINLAIWTARWEMGLKGGSAQADTAEPKQPRTTRSRSRQPGIRTADVQPKTSQTMLGSDLEALRAEFRAIGAWLDRAERDLEVLRRAAEAKSEALQ